MPSAAELGPILRAADPAAVAAFFKGAPEARRRECAPVAIAWWELLGLNARFTFSARARKELAGKEQIAEPHLFRPTAQAAMLACAALPQVKGIGIVWLPVETATEILRDRNPDWLQAYAESLCEIELSGSSSHAWRLVRALVRAGLCRPPTHDNYALAALEGIRPLPDWRENQARAARNEPPLPEPKLADLLIAERDWFETAFWRLFELDGTGEISLANMEKYGGARRGWSDGLVELAQRGGVSRARLLVASLDALSRDFVQFRAGWFSRFHEALRPTPAERAACADRYLGLLASSIPPTVAFALGALAEVDATDPLPAAKLLPALPPVLGSAGQATVKTALQLLERLAARDPENRGEACGVAVAGLLHEKTDVQKQVLELLERHADPRDAVLRARVAEVAEAVAASLRPRLQPWLDRKSDGSAPLSARAAVGPVAASPRVLARIDPARAMAPVTQVDDLLDLAGRTLESPENPNEVECLLDGISRLCGVRPDDFARRSSALRKRALKWRDEPSGMMMADPLVRRTLAALIVAWLDREDGSPDSTEALIEATDESAWFYRRVLLLGRQAAAGTARPFLSAPTHVGGWIEARALVERWLEFQKLGVVPDAGEQVLALLRLAPEAREAALPAAAALTGETGRAVRHALGEAAPIGEGALWLAACRSLQPFGPLPVLKKRGATRGAGANLPAQDSAWFQRICLNEDRQADADPADGQNLTIYFRLPGRFQLLSSLPLLRWSALLWPANLERMFARSIGSLEAALGWADGQDRGTAGYLELLAEPHTELRPMACQALALGLGAQDPTLRGHANEALIAAVADGRLDAPVLGSTMARLVDFNFSQLARWARSLGEVARVSPAHARAMNDLLVRLLHGNPTNAPRNLGAVLELLYELLSETGARLEDPAARDYLSGLRIGGKTARLAKQILAIGSAGESGDR